MPPRGAAGTVFAVQMNQGPDCQERDSDNEPPARRQRPPADGLGQVQVAQWNLLRVH